MTNLLAGAHPILEQLREQWEVAKEKKGWIELDSYRLPFEAPEGVSPLFREGHAVIQDVRARVDGLTGPVEVKLFVNNGYLRMMCAVAPNEESWPEDAQLRGCYYVGEDETERSTRDLPWGLGEILKILSIPRRDFLDDLPEHWGEEHEALVFELVPEHGAADTVQGEVLRAALRVTAEFFREGCGNWSETPEFFREFVEFLLTHLCDGTFDSETDSFTRELLSMLTNFGESDSSSQSPDDEEVLDRDLNILEQIAAAWCLRHPDPIMRQQPD